MRWLSVFVIILFVAIGDSAAQNLPPAPVLNDEGGVQFIRGQGEYTFPYFRLFLPQPYIVMYDAAGVLDKDVYFIPRPESQVIGTITSDPFTSPFTYQISLPHYPAGQLRDVDNNGRDDAGVGIYMLAVTSNTWNDPFLELRDDYVTGVLRSAEVSSDIDSFMEITSGWLLVYAPDNQQGFPSGRGADGVLFTADDPIVQMPQGWTVVDTDAEVFTFSRQRDMVLNLREAEDAALDDLSQLSYIEAFDSMIDLLKRKYAFTEYKQVDWEALRTEFRPRVERAQQNRSATEFRRVLRELSWRVPDGHVSGPVLAEDFQMAAAGGMGLVLREIEGGRLIVTEVLPEGSAAQAGVGVRWEVLSVDGTPAADAVRAVVPYTGPFSTAHNLRLEQIRFLLRGTIGQRRTVEFRRPDGQIQSLQLTQRFDVDGFYASAYTPMRETAGLPVEYRLLDSGIAKIDVLSFSDNLPLTVALWERAMLRAKSDGVVGIIVDIRQNGGGSGFLGDQLPAYFFDRDYPIGNRAVYSALRDTFVVNPLTEERFILPPSQLRYDGKVAVLISPDCASACESFAYAMTINNRAVIVGHYPTAGLGGSVVPIALPDGSMFYYTNTRSLGADGEINIEGKGVAPTMRVPVTEDVLFADYDVLLDAAVKSLLGTTPLPTSVPDAPSAAGQGELPAIAVGQTLTGTVSPDAPAVYLLTLGTAARLDIVATGDGPTERGLVVRLRRPDTFAVLSENFALPGGNAGAGFRGLALPANLTVIIEVAVAAPRVSGTYTLSVNEAK
jgi:C-terminal processing protease CtpA/Prc